MKSADCKEVWRVIRETEAHLPKALYDELCDTFCDFECAWEEHAKQYHSEDADV